MKKDILLFILGSIYDWKDDSKIGEEVRALEYHIIDAINGKQEPVMDYLLYLIYKYNSNEKLGSEVRDLHLPILIAYDKASTN